MRVRKAYLIAVILFSFLLTFGVSSTSAEVWGLLEEVWFKLKVEFSGKEYVVDTETLSDTDFILTAYLHVTYNGDGTYTPRLFTKNADGEWEQTGGGIIAPQVSGPREKFLILADHNFGQWRKKTKFISFFKTAYIKIKKSSGEFESASFESLGAEVLYGQNDSGTKQFYGGAKVTGESIDFRDLPFREGVLYFSQDGNGNGLYRLNTSTGAATLVGISGVTGTTVGLAYNRYNDLLYGSKFAGLLHIQRDGSGSVDVGGAAAEGLAYDPIRKVLYGAINGTFFTLNTSNGSKITDLAAPGFDAEGLAVDPSTGTVYAVGDDTILKRYDPDTDTWTTVGDTGLNWDSGGLAYNYQRNRLYACGEEQGNVLYKISPDTAVAKVIGDSGVNLRGGLAFASGALPIELVAPAVLPADEDIVDPESEITSDEW